MTAAIEEFSSMVEPFLLAGGLINRRDRARKVDVREAGSSGFG
jgi:hypothetical protein